MRAIEIFEEVYRQYHFKCFSPEILAVFSFEDHFNDTLHSFQEFRVGRRFISGTQGIEPNSREKFKSDIRKLDSSVADDGCWLWVYQDSGKFDLINYKNDDTLNKLITEIREDRNLIAILKLRR